MVLIAWDRIGHMQSQNFVGLQQIVSANTGVTGGLWAKLQNKTDLNLLTFWCACHPCFQKHDKRYSRAKTFAFRCCECQYILSCQWNLCW